MALLGGPRSLSDVSLTLQNLMGVGTWPVGRYLLHHDREGPASSSTWTLSSVDWHSMKVGKGATFPAPLLAPAHPQPLFPRVPVHSLASVLICQALWAYLPTRWEENTWPVVGA